MSKSRSISATAITIFWILFLVSLLALPATGREPRTLRMSSDPHPILLGRTLGGPKAAVDTLVVFGGPGTLEGKFEDAAGLPDLQGWTPVDMTGGVGSFGQVWTGLGDRDECNTNYSPQLAFIDDGLIVPGTGGYMCNLWCYGPEGYIVNPEGGLAGPDSLLHSEVWSPPIPWPTGTTIYDGGLFSFDVYRDMDYTLPGYPGMFYVWSFRSTASADPADLENEPWLSDGYAYFGTPAYLRVEYDVSDLLVEGARFVQVGLPLVS